MMRIFFLTDSDTCNLKSSCSLAGERVNQYWKFETIAYEIQNKSLFCQAFVLLIENISTQNKNEMGQFTVTHTNTSIFNI